MAPKKVDAKPRARKPTAASSDAPTSLATSGATAQVTVSRPHIPFVSVCYTNEPLSFYHHFSHKGGVDCNMMFNLRQELPIFKDVDKCAFIPRSMHWDLVKEQDGIAVGALTCHGVRTVGYNQHVTALGPCLFSKEYPIGEVASLANTFIRRFIAMKDEFPAQVVRSPGWVHSTKAGWWTWTMEFVLNELETPLTKSGLGCPVMATRYGITQSHYNFFAILERYNPETCTFFTPIGELGFAIHEMHDISNLPFGELPYDEFIPGAAMLKILRKEALRSMTLSRK